MSSPKQARWLISELPALIQQNILDESSASSLENHYRSLAEKKGPNPIFIVTGILGALLIGAGIISIFAYNWENFGRGLRAFLSIAPLLIAQGFYAYAYFKKKDSVAWIESTSGFLSLMIASSIALISQTYNIGGNMADFLWSWMLLTIPLMYLRNSSLTAMIYLAGITAWTFNVPQSTGEVVKYWGLLAAVIPHLWKNIAKADSSIRANLLGWASGISFLYTMATLPEWRVEGGGFIAYALLFGLLYILGKNYFEQDAFIWKKPYQFIAIAGTFVMGMFFSFESIPMDVSMNEIFLGKRGSLGFWGPVANWTNLGISLICLGGSSFMIWKHLQKAKGLNYFVISFPGLVLAYVFLGGTGLIAPEIFTVLFNLFILGFGIFYLREGIRQDRLSLVNAGMFMMSALFIMRFFDQDFSFLVKGIAFLFIGASFLGVNLYLAKKKE
ncbi:MAG: DUF2157 domain-containing protein [Bacteroidota bacterium]